MVVSSDARTTVTSASPSLSITNRTQIRVASDSDFYGTANYTVTFEGVSVTGIVEVVAVIFVSLAYRPYPSFSGSSSIDKTVLSLVQCTSVYQRAQLVANAQLSDGSAAVDVSSATTFSIIGDSGLSLAAGILTPSESGTYSVSGIFGRDSLSVGPLSISVVDTRVQVSSLRQTTGWTQDTFSGLSGTTRPLLLAVTFSDGTQYVDAVSGTQSAWIAPSLYLAFTSSSTAFVTVSDAGVATLVGNSFGTVSLTATATCGTGAITALPAGSDSVSANVEPAQYDVDIGSLLGST
jgi:hypothetical protein